MSHSANLLTHLTADDSSMAVVAGQTWGGGGTVNWSASLQTPGFVRKEWATKDNLPFFPSSLGFSSFMILFAN